MRDVVVVLARAPQPGEGKTRLRAQLRGHHAGDVDRLVHALAADTLEWAGRARSLVVAGRGDAQALRDIAPCFAHHVAQRGETFGARIENAIAAGFAAGGRDGPSRVVQIGTDSPTLPDWLIDSAFACLGSATDAVLVPALDGGWIALGVARPLHGALTASAVRWSTEHAAADTISALRAGGRDVSVLSPWYDVDDADGLRRLRRDPSAARRAPRTSAAAWATA